MYHFITLYYFMKTLAKQRKQAKYKFNVLKRTKFSIIFLLLILLTIIWITVFSLFGI